MKTRELIDKHELAIEILEGVQSFERRIKQKKDSIQGIAGHFPRLIQEYTDNIYIYHKCIDRLLQRHDKLMNRGL